MGNILGNSVNNLLYTVKQYQGVRVLMNFMSVH